MEGPIRMPCCPYSVVSWILEVQVYDFRASCAAGEWLVVTYIKTSLTIFYLHQPACPSNKNHELIRLRRGLV
jgi:hypothetical protein